MDDLSPCLDLILVDLSESMDHESEIDFKQVLDEALLHCAEVKPNDGSASNEGWSVCGLTPSCFEHHSSSLPLFVADDAVQSRLKEKLQKYIKRQDKFLNLTSLLIKSETFHRFHQSDTTMMNLPVINLPRTAYGKPYIPPTDDSDPPLFSVSHQFPFVGVCRTLETNGFPPNLSLGMDIVMFDDINSRLYSSEMEFCRVFRGNFAHGEWSCIEKAQYPVKEFYLRWAIKEAYTKALGKGMSLKFDSFQTKLDAAKCRYGWSLWDHLQQQNVQSKTRENAVHRLWGTFSTLDNGDMRESERWLLLYVPLSCLVKEGYVCICLGPVEDEEAFAGTALSRLDTTLSDLIQFHTANRKGTNMEQA